MLADKVHLRRFVLLGGELDGAIQQVHLVDEQISEDAGAVDDDVNSRSAEFFQRNQFQFVDSAQSIRDRVDTNHQHDLRQRLTVRLDVVGTPQDQSDGLRVDAVVLDALTFNQTVDDNLRGSNRGTSRDRLRIQGVDVLTRRQNLRVTNRIPARARQDVPAVQSFRQGTELVVLDNLLQAKSEVVKQRAHFAVVNLFELGALQGIAPRQRDGGIAKHFAELAERVSRDSSSRVSRVLDKRTDAISGRKRDVLQHLDVFQFTGIVSAVDVFDIFADSLCQQLRHTDDAVFLAVDAGNVDQSRNRFLRGRRATDDVQTARQQS